MDLVYREWVCGRWSWRQILPYIFNRKAAIVCSRKYKRPRGTVFVRPRWSLAAVSYLALLVHPSGTVHPTVFCHEFTSSHMPDPILYVTLSIVYLDSDHECGFHVNQNGFQFLAPCAILCLVFASPVTYVYAHNYIYICGFS